MLVLMCIRVLRQDNVLLRRCLSIFCREQTSLSSPTTCLCDELTFVFKCLKATRWSSFIVFCPLEERSFVDLLDVRVKSGESFGTVFWGTVFVTLSCAAL